MDEKSLNASLVELRRTKRRLDKVIQVERRHLDFLERSSDGCWDYPDADEKYELYTDKMQETGDRIRKLVDIIDNIEYVIGSIDSIKKTYEAELNKN
jgi:hypothetical protein